MPLQRGVILALDAAGAACSAAVAADGALRAARRLTTVHGQAEAMVPLVDQVMREAGLDPAALDVVVVTIGPGGFTGIRVGLAAARGIALATGARLLGVTSFAAVAAPIPAGGETRLVALESRREDLYVQLFDGAGRPLGAPMALLPPALEAAVAAAVGAAALVVAGDAAERAAAALAGRARTRLLADSAPDAMGALAAARHSGPASGEPDPVRPLYLRAPDATLPRPAAGPPA
jgi:tRNA threonylcarbamoyladenosine biosynthesis protein TsaB